ELPKRGGIKLYRNHAAASLHYSELPKRGGIILYRNHAAASLHYSELPKRGGIKLYRNHAAASLHYSELPKRGGIILYRNHAAASLHYSELPKCGGIKLYRNHAAVGLHRSELPKHKGIAVHHNHGAATLHHTDIPNYAAVTLHESERTAHKRVALHRSELLKHSAATRSIKGQAINSPEFELSNQAQSTHLLERTNVKGNLGHNRKPSKRQRKAAKKLEILGQMTVLDNISNLLLGRRKNTVQTPVMELDKFFELTSHSELECPAPTDPVADAVMTGIEGIKSLFGSIHLPTLSILQKQETAAAILDRSTVIEKGGPSKKAPLKKAAMKSAIPDTETAILRRKARAISKSPGTNVSKGKRVRTSSSSSITARKIARNEKNSNFVTLKSKSPTEDLTLLPEEQAGYPRADCKEHENPARPKCVPDIVGASDHPIGNGSQPVTEKSSSYVNVMDSPEYMIPAALTLAIPSAIPIARERKLSEASVKETAIGVGKRRMSEPIKSTMLSTPKFDMSFLPEERTSYLQEIDFHKSSAPFIFPDTPDINKHQIGLSHPLEPEGNMENVIATPAVTSARSKVVTEYPPPPLPTWRSSMNTTRKEHATTSTSTVRRQYKKSTATAVALWRPKTNILLYPEEQPEYPRGDSAQMEVTTIPKPLAIIVKEIQLDPAHQRSPHDFHPTMVESAAAAVTHGIEGIKSFIWGSELPDSDDKVSTMPTYAKHGKSRAQGLGSNPTTDTKSSMSSVPVYFNYGPVFGTQVRNFVKVPIEPNPSPVYQEMTELPSRRKSTAGHHHPVNHDTPGDTSNIIRRRSTGEASRSAPGKSINRPVPSTHMEPAIIEAPRVDEKIAVESIKQHRRLSPPALEEVETSSSTATRQMTFTDSPDWGQELTISHDMDNSQQQNITTGPYRRRHRDQTDKEQTSRRRSTYGVSHEIDPALFENSNYHISVGRMSVDPETNPPKEVEKSMKHRQHEDLQGLPEPLQQEHRARNTANITAQRVTSKKEAFQKHCPTHLGESANRNRKGDNLVTPLSAISLHKAIAVSYPSSLNKEQEYKPTKFVPSGQHQRNMAINFGQEFKENHQSDFNLKPQADPSVIISRKSRSVCVVPTMPRSTIYAGSKVAGARFDPTTEKYHERHSHRSEFSSKTMHPCKQAAEIPSRKNYPVLDTVSVSKILTTQHPVVTQSDVSPMTSSNLGVNSIVSSESYSTVYSTVIPPSSLSSSYSTSSQTTTSIATDMHFHLPHFHHRDKEQKEKDGEEGAKHSVIVQDQEKSGVKVGLLGFTGDTQPYSGVHEQINHNHEHDANHGPGEKRETVFGKRHNQPRPHHHDPDVVHPSGTEIFNMAAPSVAPFISGAAAMQTSRNGWNMAELHDDVYHVQPNDKHTHEGVHQRQFDYDVTYDSKHQQHRYVPEPTVVTESKSTDSVIHDGYKDPLSSTAASWTSHEEPGKKVSPRSSVDQYHNKIETEKSFQDTPEQFPQEHHKHKSMNPYRRTLETASALEFKDTQEPSVDNSPEANHQQHRSNNPYHHTIDTITPH
ncbi:hypothetical protein BGZ76_004885, partial [Entomortierella beljakovae]